MLIISKFPFIVDVAFMRHLIGGILKIFSSDNIAKYGYLNHNVQRVIIIIENPPISTYVY